MTGYSTAVVPPLTTGIALAVTTGVFYALCTLAWVMAPGPFLYFMNSLFHGLDFTTMVQSRPFGLLGFITALIVLCIWGLFIGTFFGWLRQRLTP
jgi:2TM family of unknown function (DUF5676)